jgi:hypothetical protein
MSDKPIPKPVYQFPPKSPRMLRNPWARTLISSCPKSSHPIVLATTKSPRLSRNPFKLALISSSPQSSRPIVHSSHVYVNKLPASTGYKLVSFDGDFVVGNYYKIGDEVYKQEPGGGYWKQPTAVSEGCYTIRCASGMRLISVNSKRLRMTEVGLINFS